MPPGHNQNPYESIATVSYEFPTDPIKSPFRLVGVMMVGILKPFRVVSDAFLCVFPVRAAGWIFSQSCWHLSLCQVISASTLP